MKSICLLYNIGVSVDDSFMQNWSTSNFFFGKGIFFAIEEILQIFQRPFFYSIVNAFNFVLEKEENVVVEKIQKKCIQHWNSAGPIFQTRR